MVSFVRPRKHWATKTGNSIVKRAFAAKVRLCRRILVRYVGFLSISYLFSPPDGDKAASAKQNRDKLYINERLEP